MVIDKRNSELSMEMSFFHFMPSNRKPQRSGGCSSTCGEHIIIIVFFHIGRVIFPIVAIVVLV